MSGRGRSVRRGVIGIGFAVAVSGSLAWADPPDGHGGGEFVFDDVPHLSESQREAIWAAIQANVAELRRQGKLPAGPRIDANPLLGWPLRAAGHLRDYGYHGISGFVDQDPAYPGSLLDYECGARTYDTDGGYNHQGIDYFTWPFGWLKMDHADVEVVAAAPGTIVYRQDGNYDRSCSFNSNNWNAVYVQHADGSIAWYGHLKNGSVTPKLVGETVVEGEYLGVVGSSGNSTGPHLHLEVYDSGSNLNEPHQGPCNAMNGNSWWKQQRPYFDSAVNAVATGVGPPYFPSCPDPEVPAASNDFNPGDTVYFVTYYRDQLDTQSSTYTIYRPDGTVWQTWTHNSPVSHYTASYWYWWYSDFAPGGPTGIWKFEVDFEGEAYERYFRISDANGAGRVPGQLNEPVPLTAERSGTDVTLSWAPSCVETDADYEVYEGAIGSWYSHGAKLCTTAGATTATFAPGAGATYYLVVPTDTSVEGSYGWDSNFVERPQGASACRSQQVGGSCVACGNGVRQGSETCDQPDLGGETCVSQGWGAGTLACNTTCDGFDYSGCNPCGNSVCEPGAGENCLNCPPDCNGDQQGGGQFCCGNGAGNNPVGCEDARCTADGNTCQE